MFQLKSSTGGGGNAFAPFPALRNSGSEKITGSNSYSSNAGRPEHRFRHHELVVP